MNNAPQKTLLISSDVAAVLADSFRFYASLYARPDKAAQFRVFASLHDRSIDSSLYHELFKSFRGRLDIFFVRSRRHWLDAGGHYNEATYRLDARSVDACRKLVAWFRSQDRLLPRANVVQAWAHCVDLTAGGTTADRDNAVRVLKATQAAQPPKPLLVSILEHQR